MEENKEGRLRKADAEVRMPGEQAELEAGAPSTAGRAGQGWASPGRRELRAESIEGAARGTQESQGWVKRGFCR